MVFLKIWKPKKNYEGELIQTHPHLHAFVEESNRAAEMFHELAIKDLHEESHANTSLKESNAYAGKVKKTLKKQSDGTVIE